VKYKLLVSLIGILCLGLQVSALGQSKSWDAYIKTGDDAIAQKRYSESEQAYRDALKLTEDFKNNDPRMAATLIKLAEALSLQSRQAEAESLATRAVGALRAAIKASKPNDQQQEFYQSDGAASLFDKAASIFETGQKYDEAATLYKKVIPLREEAVQPDRSPKSNADFIGWMVQVLTDARLRLADAYDKLARMYMRQQKFAEAGPLYVKALKVVEAQYGPNQTPTAMALSRLATLYAMQGKPDRAEPLYSRAIRILESANNMDLAEGALVYENYSLFLRKTGHEAEAAAMLTKARALRNTTPGTAK
jgi:tetratricopeptide (TPR) repeat protein